MIIIKESLAIEYSFSNSNLLCANILPFFTVQSTISIMYFLFTYIKTVLVKVEKVNHFRLFKKATDICKKHTHYMHK